MSCSRRGKHNAHRNLVFKLKYIVASHGCDTSERHLSLIKCLKWIRLKSFLCIWALGSILVLCVCVSKLCNQCIQLNTACTCLYSVCRLSLSSQLDNPKIRPSILSPSIWQRGLFWIYKDTVSGRQIIHVSRIRHTKWIASKFQHWRKEDASVYWKNVIVVRWRVTQEGRDAGCKNQIAPILCDVLRV